jgi:TetR/AcrR family transcriptional regulator, cholesterol catabolism regulator
MGSDGVSKSERTRQRILDSAARVLRRHGHGARLSDVAAEAGMQTGSLYYHFDSRESLVEEVLRLGLEAAWAEVRHALDELPPSATPLQRLETAVRAHAGAVLATSDYTAANSRIFSTASPAVHDRHYVLQQRYGEYFNDLLAEAVRSGELRDDLDLPVVRMLLFGAMNWTSEWYRPDSGRPPQLVIDQLVGLVLGGLAAPPYRLRVGHDLQP